MLRINDEHRAGIFRAVRHDKTHWPGPGQAATRPACVGPHDVNFCFDVNVVISFVVIYANIIFCTGTNST